MVIVVTMVALCEDDALCDDAGPKCKDEACLLPLKTAKQA